MSDLILSIYSAISGVDVKNINDIPWGWQLVVLPIIGFVIGMIVLKFIGNEKKNED